MIENTNIFYVSIHDSTCDDSNSYILLNSLVPGRCGNTSKIIILKLITQNSSLGTSCEITPRWMPQILANEMSALVQVMV